MSVVEKVIQQISNPGRDSLIPVLQAVQEEEGFISRESVIEIGKALDLPASKIYGVATFYNQFRFSPNGKWTIQVCRGTACHVKGSANLLARIERELGIKAGETTRDNMFSIEVVACIGACGLAPVIAINGNFHAKVKPDDIPEILRTYRKKSEEAGK
ncbi:MAG: NADH-quinone oxidoreductase subunit NuoE [Candidatus Riflebacteria bacterium HGW-Riflebacteria-2]|jgi:NADH-quinone oxidoreductase subunit E|nr:MAG: NADH-quinone oxidoreductase subunit NuoE [Candidatus Riflebacteria bacterium HGW-Riflebacteria-2]